MIRVPIDRNGYSVSTDGTVHTRYADHGGGKRTRTVKGVETLLSGKRGKACGSCYPHPQYPDAAPRKPQRRRNGPRTTRKPKGA